MVTCIRPKCFKTKKSKCTYPNPWIMYVQKHSGKGLSRAQLRTGYAVWKNKQFSDNLTSSVTDRNARRGKMCDIISGKKSSSSSKASASKKITLAARQKLARKKVSTLRARKASSDKKKASASKKITLAARQKLARKKVSTLRKRKASSDKKKASASKKITLAARQKLARKKVSTLRKRKASSDKKKASASKKITLAARQKLARKKVSTLRSRKASSDRKRASASKKITLAASRAIARRRVAVLAKKRSEALKASASKKITLAAKQKLARKRVASKESKLIASATSKITRKSDGFFSTCAIDRAHISTIRRTFKSIEKPDRGASLCDHVKNFYQLPGGTKINRVITDSDNSSRYFVYSGTFNRSPVFIKIAKLQNSKSSRGLIPMSKQEFSYVQAVHRNINRVFGGVSIFPSMRASGISLDGKLGYDISSAVNGVDLESQMTSSKPSPFRKDLMKKLGVMMARTHKHATHGDAHFKNIVVKPDGRLSFIDVERMLFFSRSGASSREVKNARLYDIMQVVISILFKKQRLSEEKSVSSRTVSTYKTSDYMTFSKSYISEMGKMVSSSEVSDLKSGMEKMLDRFFVNKSLKSIQSERNTFFVKGYWVSLSKAITIESNKKSHVRTKRVTRVRA